MQSEHYSKKFKLDIDDYDVSDNHPNEAIREDMQELKLEKLGQRVTLITILIPILIAIIVAVSYLDIKQRVAQTQTTGTLGVQNLSKDLESRFSSLSVRQAKLEDEVKKQTEILEKKWAEYAVQHKRLEDKIAELTKQMVAKKELSEATTTFDTSLRTLQKKIAGEQKVLETIQTASDQNLNQMTAFKEETHQKIDSLSKAVKETSTIVTEKLDKNQLDVALKIRDLKLREQIQQQTQHLESEISRLNEKNAALTRELQSALNKIKALSKSEVKQNNASTESTPPATSTPKKGKIVEQNLN